MTEMKRVFNAGRWREVEEGPKFDKMIADGWEEVEREGILIPDITTPIDAADTELVEAVLEARNMTEDELKEVTEKPKKGFFG